MSETNVPTMNATDNAVAQNLAVDETPAQHHVDQDSSIEYDVIAVLSTILELTEDESGADESGAKPNDCSKSPNNESSAKSPNLRAFLEYEGEFGPGHALEQPTTNNKFPIGENPVEMTVINERSCEFSYEDFSEQRRILRQIRAGITSDSDSRSLTPDYDDTPAQSILMEPTPKPANCRRKLVFEKNVGSGECETSPKPRTSQEDDIVENVACDIPPSEEFVSKNDDEIVDGSGKVGNSSKPKVCQNPVPSGSNNSQRIDIPRAHPNNSQRIQNETIRPTNEPDTVAIKMAEKTIPVAGRKFKVFKDAEDYELDSDSSDSLVEMRIPSQRPTVHQENSKMDDSTGNHENLKSDESCDVSSADSPNLRAFLEYEGEFGPGHALEQPTQNNKFPIGENPVEMTVINERSCEFSYEDLSEQRRILRQIRKGITSDSDSRSLTPDYDDTPAQSILMEPTPKPANCRRKLVFEKNVGSGQSETSPKPRTSQEDDIVACDIPPSEEFVAENVDASEKAGNSSKPKVCQKPVPSGSNNSPRIDISRAQQNNSQQHQTITGLSPNPSENRQDTPTSSTPIPSHEYAPSTNSAEIDSGKMEKNVEKSAGNRDDTVGQKTQPRKTLFSTTNRTAREQLRENIKLQSRHRDPRTIIQIPEHVLPPEEWAIWTKAQDAWVKRTGYLEHAFPPDEREYYWQPIENVSEEEKVFILFWHKHYAHLIRPLTPSSPTNAQVFDASSQSPQSSPLESPPRNHTFIEQEPVHRNFPVLENGDVDIDGYCVPNEMWQNWKAVQEIIVKTSPKPVEKPTLSQFAPSCSSNPAIIIRKHPNEGCHTIAFTEELFEDARFTVKGCKMVAVGKLKNTIIDIEKDESVGILQRTDTFAALESIIRAKVEKEIEQKLVNYRGAKVSPEAYNHLIAQDALHNFDNIDDDDLMATEPQPEIERYAASPSPYISPAPRQVVNRKRRARDASPSEPAAKRRLQEVVAAKKPARRRARVVVPPPRQPKASKKPSTPAKPSIHPMKLRSAGKTRTQPSKRRADDDDDIDDVVAKQQKIDEADETDESTAEIKSIEEAKEALSDMRNKLDCHDFGFKALYLNETHSKLTKAIVSYSKKPTDASLTKILIRTRKLMDDIERFAQ